jgi:PEP-CTERM motif-containing protein
MQNSRLAFASASFGGAISADYTSIADGCAASFSLAGTTVSGSANVCSGAFIGVRGLGVLGGGSSLSLDLGETMTINFGQLVNHVTLTLVDIDPPGNVTFAFQAFNNATSLGNFAFPAAAVNPTTFNLDLLDGGLSLTQFVISISASAPLGLQIQGTSYDVAGAVPEPATSALIGVGLGLLCFRRFRPRRR